MALVTPPRRLRVPAAPPLTRAPHAPGAQALPVAEAAESGGIAAEAAALVADVALPPPPPAPAAGAASFATLRDETLAYSFDYPVSTAAGRELSWVATRSPTRCADTRVQPPRTAPTRGIRLLTRSTPRRRRRAQLRLRGAAVRGRAAAHRVRGACTAHAPRAAPCLYARVQPSLFADVARTPPLAQLANFKGPLTLAVTVGPPPPVLGASSARACPYPRALSAPAPLRAQRCWARRRRGSRRRS
jgi:hypothetical protein